MALRIRQTYNEKLIQELDKQVFPDDDPVTTEGHLWWVIYDGKTPVAYAGAKYIVAETVVYLSRAGVLESHRGKHLQRRLIRARVRWARKIGATQAITYTFVDNPASSNNLIKCGFVTYVPEWKWGGKNAIYWVYKFRRNNERRED